MKCLRCNNEMKHYQLNTVINVFGAEYKPYPFSSMTHQDPHHIHSVYIYDDCGYVELSTKYCDKPDL